MASTVFFYLLLLYSISLANCCTLICVGKNATADGSTIVAHTDDAGGGAADVRLVRVPSMKYTNGSERPVYKFNGGYPRLVSKDRGKHYSPNNGQKLSQPLGYIPQVPTTYAYFDQDYGMMNEVQLAIGESTCSAKTVGWPMDVPYGYNMFGIAELSKVALERCDSARCAIKTMGDLSVKHGFYSEDSGDPKTPGYTDSAETLGISDKYGEVWVFHVLTGAQNRSAIWAAQRVPDNHVVAAANGFVIRQMNLSDHDNFMASDNVERLALEMGWWDPSTGPFDFTAAYAYSSPGPLYPLYVGRRLWRIYDIFAPSLKLDSRLGFITTEPTYPFSVHPDTPISISQMMEVLRDHYEGTPYDMTKGIAAGPFGNPVRYDGPSHNVNGGWERSISMYRTIFSFLLHVQGKLADPIGGTIWYGQGSPHGTVYVPFSCAQESVPESYLIGKQSQFSQDSAWWAFSFVNNWSQLRFNKMYDDIRKKQGILQKKALDIYSEALDQANDFNSKKNTSSYLENHFNEFAKDVVSQWWDLAWDLVSKFSDGYITTGENPNEMQEPGYPKWWLEETSFASWPGDTFLEPGNTKNLKSRLSGLSSWSIAAIIIACILIGISVIASTISVIRRRNYYKRI